MRPLPEQGPDVDRRWVMRIAPKQWSAGDGPALPLVVRSGRLRESDFRARLRARASARQKRLTRRLAKLARDAYPREADAPIEADRSVPVPLAMD